MINPMPLADYIINLCNHDFKCGLTNPKFRQSITLLYLNKLLYYLNVLYMLKYNQHTINLKTLVPKYSFCMYNTGAVVQYVYDDYKCFGGNQITHPVKHIQSMHFNKNGINHTKYIKYNSQDVPRPIQDFVKQNLPKLLRFDAITLTHYTQQNPQWLKAYYHGKIFKVNYNITKDFKFYQKRNNQFWIHATIQKHSFFC